MQPYGDISPALQKYHFQKMENTMQPYDIGIKTVRKT